MDISHPFVSSAPGKQASGNRRLLLQAFGATALGTLPGRAGSAMVRGRRGCVTA